MFLFRTASIIGGAFLVLSGVYAIQKPFRVYPGVEYTQFPLPPDYQEKTEWVFGRLMYPPVGRSYGGFAFYGSYKEGASNWTMNYPRSDRHFTTALRRLTRIHTRSVEQPLDLDDGEAFDWPWLYGVEVGHWDLSDAQAKAMREYLLRGGFFMCDDFHGAIEWNVFKASMSKVFPDRPIVDLRSDDPVFHTLYDLDQKWQVPGALYLETGLTYEKGETGKDPHWRGIYDDRGRLMVAICHNMDLGDSWEHADNPAYPERFSDLGIRIGVNYVIYSMTH